MLEKLELPEGWLSLFLLFIMLISAALSVSTARWTDKLDNLTITAMLGLLAGLLLAKSRFPATIAHMFSLIYGLFAVGYLIGNLIEQPTWRERLIALGERLMTWLTKATSGGTSRDSLMFVLLMSSLFWLLGYVAAWYTFRRSSLWRAVLPTGVAVLVNYYIYTDPGISTRSTASLGPFVTLFMLAALLYAVRTNVFLRELEWRGHRAVYDVDVRIDFVRSGALLAVVAALIMIIAPGAQAAPYLGSLWADLEDVRQDVRETVSRLFASLETYGRGVANPFGSRLVLGGARQLGDQVLFDVLAPGGRYWQAVTHDYYTGDSWLNSDDHTVLLQPGQALSSQPWLMRQEITQTVTLYLPNSTQLFAAPEPLRVPQLSTRVNVSFESGLLPSASMIHSQKTLQAGNTYQIVSAVSWATRDDLRGAGNDYEQSIQERYLQLPQTVTGRTRELAQEITAGYQTAFDKAQAIEQYLRDNLRYDLNVPAPPEGQDFVDFVLFDLQVGYCDYYASSFVVLARAAGIPARLAAGYAQSDYDSEAQAYRVRARNGHSWPEVYFPDYGWIQFEPTVIIDPINWPTPPSESDDTATGGPNTGQPREPLDLAEKFRDLMRDDPEITGGPLPNLSQDEKFLELPIALVVVLLVLLALGLGGIYWATEIQGLNSLSFIERAYARMWHFAARMGIPNPPDQTPYERSTALSTLVPEGAGPIKSITDMYVVERFGRDKENGDGAQVGEKWSALRLVLWKTWLQKKLSPPQRRTGAARQKATQDKGKT